MTTSGPSTASPGRRLRLVLSINALTLGGAETQLMRVARALVAAGHDVRLLTMQPSRHFLDDVAELGIPLHQVQMDERAAAVTSVGLATAQLRRWRPDAVLSFLYQANMMCRIAARLAGVPVVVSSIRNEYFGGRGRELAMRATDRLATRTVTNSRLAARSLVARRVVSDARMVVIPNGLDVARFPVAETTGTTVREELGIGPDRFVWLGAGRLRTQKDWPTLLTAVAALPPDSTSQVLIAGEGELEQDLRELARTLGVAHRVRFLGRRDDMPELLAAVDGVVLSSTFEGLPNIVLEAMAAGLPVVATAVGGTPELVTADTGRLVAPSNPKALAAALLEVSTMADRGRGLGQCGREVVEQRYGLDAAMSSWVGLLTGLCAEHPRRG